MDATRIETCEDRLLSVAREARARAHAPYSRFPVGAALEADTGQIVPGCNLENASLGLGICAERVALFALLSRGLRPGRRLLITTLSPRPTPPCGACREALLELAPEIEVISVARDGRRKRWFVSDLLPDLLPAGSRELLDPRTLIARKRDGGELTHAEIRGLIDGLLTGQVADYQMSAFMMATCLRGMTVRETRDLTLAMLNSGGRVNLDAVEGPKVDKHSTGGGGDKVSIPLLPICLAAGLTVPMLSGRGLGYTGGTLDKLDSIPGYRSRVPIQTLVQWVAEQGGFLAGQTAELVPADRSMYALRDVSATVESLPLIVSSILSKKLSAGVSALALDVKFGRGAFMPDLKRAEELARALVSVAHDLGLPAVALLTRMDTPLGAAVGNALEIRESMALLRGEAVPADLVQLTVTLGGLMMVLAQRAVSLSAGIDEIRRQIASGRAATTAERWIAAQGGDPRVVGDARMPVVSRNRRTVTADRAAFVREIDARWAGRLCTRMGGGRLRSEDSIDPRVGIRFHVRPGEAVSAGQPLYTLYLPAAADREARRPEEERLLTLGEQPPQAAPLVESLIARQSKGVVTIPFGQAERWLPGE